MGDGEQSCLAGPVWSRLMSGLSQLVSDPGALRAVSLRPGMTCRAQTETEALRTKSQPFRCLRVGDSQSLAPPGPPAFLCELLEALPRSCGPRGTSVGGPAGPGTQFFSMSPHMA